jgi:hypothetical protein
MITKFKNFKPLTRDEMRQLKGGIVDANLKTKCRVQSGSQTFDFVCEPGYSVLQCNQSGSAYCATLRAAGWSANFLGCSDGSGIA